MADKETPAAPAPPVQRRPSSASAPQLYRESSIGIALTAALDELVVGGLMSPAIALRILSQFDRVMNESLTNDVKVDTLVKADLKTYRFIDNVWTFVLNDATFTMTLGRDEETIHVRFNARGWCVAKHSGRQSGKVCEQMLAAVTSAAE